MSILSRLPWLRTLLLRLGEFFRHPFDHVRAWIEALAVALWAGVMSFVRYVWRGIVAHHVGLTRFAIVMFCLAVLVIAGYCGYAIHVERQMTPVPGPDATVYLGQGWGPSATSDDRADFYYTPQGALIKNIRYNWLLNMERPWKRDRFASPDYMRSYGFIIDSAETPKNPGKFPVGIAPRYDPKYGEMMLDLTCAGCHTGELITTVNGVRTAVRIDGGSAHQDLTTGKPGKFAGDLGVSLLNTTINPFKFNRFAGNLLKSNDNFYNRLLLWTEMGKVLVNSMVLNFREKPFYPMEEGYGRTDGLGRIGNSTFAISLDRKNYRVANAPVSYPVIWEMPLLDWVQYTASVKQPMARNIGEAMGTGARYYLQNPFGQELPAAERFDSTAEIANLDKIEHLMRKLKAPCWPQEVFGNIDRNKAQAGHDLFYGDKFHCVGCHGPHPAPDFVTQWQAPYKLSALNPMGGPNVPHWTATALPVQDIGTDPTSALNFVQYRVDLSGTGMKAAEVQNELGPYYRTEYARQIQYYENLVTILAPDNAKFLTPPPMLPSEVFGSAIGQAMDAGFEQGRQTFAWKACNAKDSRMPNFPPTGFTAIALKAIPDKPVTPEDIAYKQYMTDYLSTPTLTSACAGMNKLFSEGIDGYLKENLGNVQLNSVDQGTGLNYLITLVRNRAYENMGIDNPNRGTERDLVDGFAQLDIPQVRAQYMARPLAGMWATPPFLHNGSVPTLYELLLPAYRRTKKFYVKGAEFDPHAVGLVMNNSQKGAYLYDTSVQGNYNTGHEFRTGYRQWTPGSPLQYGVIGPEMTDDERWAIIEYLKIRRDYNDPEDTCPESNYLPPPKVPTAAVKR